MRLSSPGAVSRAASTCASCCFDAASSAADIAYLICLSASRPLPFSSLMMILQSPPRALPFKLFDRDDNFDNDNDNDEDDDVVVVAACSSLLSKKENDTQSKTKTKKNERNTKKMSVCAFLSFNVCALEQVCVRVSFLTSAIAV
eukprot:m.99092 g.99092  ORF g.99092 m.99092 type:complete len:144 (+) comp14889_c3_seq1:833-1264(+)